MPRKRKYNLKNKCTNGPAFDGAICAQLTQITEFDI